MDKPTTEQIQWFNSLTAEKRPDGVSGWIKNCPCGESFWLETGVTLQSECDNFIIKHAGHTGIAPKLKKTHFELSELYDFTKEIKFSHEGFALFVKEYGLKFRRKNLEVDSYTTVYADADRNQYAFRFPKLHLQFTELFAQIIPELTEVNL